MVGNKTLGVNKPLILEWNNNEGLIFRKQIELDEKYLFKINQEVANNTGKPIELYPYAQITRNKKPEGLTDFFILHEGFIGVFDKELKEDGYDDIEEATPCVLEESPLIISPSVNPLVPETTRISFSTSQVSTFPDTSYPSLDFEVTVSPTKYSLEDKLTC